MKIIHALPIIATFLGSASLSSAEIVVTAPTSTTAGSLTITEDIIFTLDYSTSFTADFLYLLLDEWVISDGEQTDAPAGPGLAASYKGTEMAGPPTTLTDNMASVDSVYTANDGILRVNLSETVNIEPGQTFTIRAGSLTLDAVDGFNPQTSQVFRGNASLLHAEFVRISNVVPVPEPASTALLPAAGLLLAGIRRRRG